MPIVIIAEDGVTSLRYYVAITRGEAAAAPGPAPELKGAPRGRDAAGAATLEEGFLPPAGPLASSLAAFASAASAAGLDPVQVRRTAALVCMRSKGRAAISLTVRNGGGVRETLEQVRLSSQQVEEICYSRFKKYVHLSRQMPSSTS